MSALPYPVLKDGMDFKHNDYQRYGGLGLMCMPSFGRLSLAVFYYQFYNVKCCLSAVCVAQSGIPSVFRHHIPPSLRVWPSKHGKTFSRSNGQEFPTFWREQACSLGGSAGQGQMLADVGCACTRRALVGQRSRHLFTGPEITLVRSLSVSS